MAPCPHGSHLPSQLSCRGAIQAGRALGRTSLRALCFSGTGAGIVSSPSSGKRAENSREATHTLSPPLPAAKLASRPHGHSHPGRQPRVHTTSSRFNAPASRPLLTLGGGSPDDVDTPPCGDLPERTRRPRASRKSSVWSSLQISEEWP